MNYTFDIGWCQYQLTYNLDDTYSGPMPYTVINGGEAHVVYHTKGSLQLPTLSEGSHKLTILLEADFNPQDIRHYADTVYFTIDSDAPEFRLDTAAPNVTIQSPQDGATYPTGTQIPLVFTVNKPLSRMLYVLFDSNRTVMPSQNSTLPFLQAGQHNLPVIASDTLGNSVVSQLINFTVTDPTPTPTETVIPVDASGPMGYQVAAVVLVIAFAGSLVVVVIYRRKRRV